jgi:hypothetical protein
VDFNDDGNIDLLGGGYTGLSYILYGNNDGSLNEALSIQDKSGTVINLGKYINLKTKERITQGDDYSYFIKAHDWDNDGDLDLLISGSQGIYLRINEGTKTNPVFGIKNIKILPAHYADAIVDWDGDGLWDILGGSKDGGVYFYKNTGKLGSPSFKKKAKCLLKSTEFIDKTNSGNCSVTQIAVADYNNNDNLDLIIGNRICIDKPMSDLTAKQIKKGSTTIFVGSEHNAISSIMNL